ncbi:hypothetical protein VV869_23110 [Photobacterium sp. MCCC 1A19761]|uniref:hypothetical protein n=1 Tax=Photobacterium sp. MCCC 1A19761 TaxID=3115000 RepID=UPI00307F220E
MFKTTLEYAIKAICEKVETNTVHFQSVMEEGYFAFQGELFVRKAEDDCAMIQSEDDPNYRYKGNAVSLLTGETVWFLDSTRVEIEAQG